MKVFLVVVGALALCAGVMALEVGIVMWLWNWLAVGLFGAPTLSFWACAGFMLLLNIVFGGVKISISR